MEPELPESSSKGRKVSFNLDFNLGHLLVIFSLFLSAAGLYAHDESRLSVIEDKVETLDQANLPSRVTGLESTTQEIKRGLQDIHTDLTELRKDLNSNTIAALKEAHKSKFP